MLVMFDDSVVNLAPGSWSFIEKQSSTIADPTGENKLGTPVFSIVFVTPGGAAKQVHFPTVEKRDEQYTEIIRGLDAESRAARSNVRPVGIQPNFNSPVQYR